MSVALEARDIAKVYGHVSALAGANFGEGRRGDRAYRGQRAGKSTLVEDLVRDRTPTSGEILVDGRPVTINGPLAARRYGIETVYQDLALAPHLNPVQHVPGPRDHAAGPAGASGLHEQRGYARQQQEGLRRARRDRAQLLRQHRRHVRRPETGGRGRSRRRLGQAGHPARRAHGRAERSMQTKGVLDLIRRVRDRGLGVVFISHQMPAVLQVADDVQVMRLGRRVATLPGERYDDGGAGRGDDRRRDPG